MTGYLDVFAFHITGLVPLKSQGVIRKTLSQVSNLAEVATYCGRCGGYLSIAEGSTCVNIEAIGMVPLKVRYAVCRARCQIRIRDSRVAARTGPRDVVILEWQK